MNVMVSGSNGLLATALIDELLADCSIEMIYALSSNPREVLAKHPDDSRLNAIDFSSAAKALAAEESDVLVHTAFPRRNDSQLLKEGLVYTTELLNHVSSSCSIIHISSQSVYDPKRSVPAKEESGMEAPSSSYAEAKYESEKILDSLCAGSKRTNIRLASLIAPQFEDRVVNKLIKSGWQTGEIIISGPNNLFGFLDVKDAAEAIAAMTLRSGHTNWHNTYNVGPHQMGYSLETIANKVVEAFEWRKMSCRLKMSLDPPLMNSAIDSSRFEKDFSWQSRRSLEDTIDEIIEFQISA